MTYNICIISKGKKHALSYSFRSKSAALREVKIKNKRINRFHIGGRGFPNMKKAIRWKKLALKHPPLGYSKEGYDRVLKIEPIKIEYVYGVCKN